MHREKQGLKYSTVLHCTVLSVTPLVNLLIAVFKYSAILGAITNCTHGVTDITPAVKSLKISTLAKRDSLVLIFWGIYTWCYVCNAMSAVSDRT